MRVYIAFGRFGNGGNRYIAIVRRVSVLIKIIKKNPGLFRFSGLLCTVRKMIRALWIQKKEKIPSPCLEREANLY